MRHSSQPSGSPGNPLRRALGGDGDAWRDLVRAYSGLVFRAALRTGVSREDAEDVTQLVWQTVLSRGHAIQDPDALPAWLATTSRRLALKVRRRDQTHPTVPVPMSLQHPAPTIEQQVEEEQELERVRRALRALPLRCRTLLHALFEERKPNYARITDELGVPHGAIGPTRARCLAQLYRLMEPGSEG